jgi:hypothetical protein
MEEMIMQKAILLAATACVMAWSPVARAQCVLPYEDGIWYNYDPDTRGITWAVVEATCGDVCLNGECSHGPPFYVSLWGQCHPYDCFYGTREATLDSDGWIRTTYYQGFVTKYVWIKGYPGYSVDWLRVYIWRDYHDGRQDRASDDWLVRY